MVFAECMEVRRRTIALVILIGHQSEMNCLECHLGFSDVVVLVLLR
jgi:hypothetical protein